MAKILEEFQVEKQVGKWMRPITRLVQEVKAVGHTGDKNIVTNKIVTEEVEYTERYMIFFPQGHSIAVPADDVEQLTRLGVFAKPRMVDMDTGEEVPDGYMSPKDIVLRKQSNRPRSTGGLTDLDAME